MMFDFFKKRKLDTMHNEIQKYIETVYIPEIEDTDFGGKRSVRMTSEIQEEQQESKVKFSVRETTEKKDSDRKYSVRDNYNEKSVSDFMRKLSDSVTAEASDLDKSINMSFVDKMLDYIDKKQLRDVAVYKAAQVDRRLFSKIVTDRNYKPAKDTCMALIFALHLNLEETNDLLSRAGYTLSHSSKRDVVLEYFIKEKVYNLNDINEILYRLGQKTLGR